MKKALSYILFLASAMTVAAIGLSCEKQEVETWGEDTPFKEIPLTTKQAGFVQNGNTFAMRYLEAIEKDNPGSFIVSPLSAQFVLGMLLNGAQGQTAAEITKVLGYGSGEVEQVNAFLRLMLDELPKLDGKTKMTIADGIFVNEKYPLKSSYIDKVGKNYYAQVENLDFSSQSSLKKINAWCSDKTEGLIKDPLKPEQFGPAYIAYIINALYFKGMWANEFSPSNTSKETFTFADGKKGKVEMMKQSSSFSYTSTDLCEALFLPYGNGNFSMEILLPTKGHTTSELASALAKEGFAAKLRYGDLCNVEVWLPKFESKFHIELSEILSSLGMPTTFSSSADFSQMSTVACHVDFFQQDALIKVFEQGSEAAAVTIAGMRYTAAGPIKNISFHADRPFLYLIRENSTGAILFAGRYSGE